jgi:hypothetical protein
MQGQSLGPLLRGEVGADHHRPSVRSEYYRALNPDPRPDFEGSYGTMFYDGRYKLSVYHGHEYGELYDLENDPGEFTNLWENPDHAPLRFELLKRSFDAAAFAIDLGPEQTVKS